MCDAFSLHVAFSLFNMSSAQDYLEYIAKMGSWCVDLHRHQHNLRCPDGHEVVHQVTLKLDGDELLRIAEHFPITFGNM